MEDNKSRREIAEKEIAAADVTAGGSSPCRDFAYSAVETEEEIFL